MPEVTIKYKKPETLKILKGLAKYFDFQISPVKNNNATVNSITMLPQDKDADISELEEIFTGRNINAADLRKKAWQRGK